ncbi:Sog2p KNAG_0E00340 [Huiozyma naganishii CBS 8797]|uniref:RAM signaling network component n=1 Tax=Huiozyma naganishii (strain ATCC MYA-139 / BCRC 22969 / CBS 8797 / KCTC 17520 / NBRC 10181 / NCYC 3082 / Yp74L-3) TaxID=1071383 RepID=J7RYQ0_HUIN7|nr:hypothetical protein KNAG_0E00340 [Kazachstania naganishii CBS 8797]CCK70302.1 hypothetical protein KNAG_0E00340 [Kazachstania naganishii CBS 8797]
MNGLGEPDHSNELEALISKQLSSGNSVKLVSLELESLTTSTIVALKPVERLSLRKNSLTTLPSSFADLKNLRYLDLNCNNFREIPVSLYGCPKLEILDLSSNKIKSLPDDIPPVWTKHLKVLSLKNNRIVSIWDLRNVVRLQKLEMLDIDGNNIPTDELELVQKYTPTNASIPRDEYWALALQRYFEDHPEQIHSHQQQSATSIPTTANNPNNGVTTNLSSLHQEKFSKASKRMGFISTGSPNSGQGTSTANNEIMSTSNPELENETSGSTELYNHTKYNDYFKRLSVLSEESVINEHYKVSHSELVVACRKLLFSFTECQQVIRKIASFCKEKSIAVNIVTLLYSVRSHIDNLVEFLQQAETQKDFNDQAMIKLCITITTIFKQIISCLRKNFEAFFAEDDLCFIRMFYMTLLCSYSEIYNSWCFISSGGPPLKKTSARKHTLKRNDSAINMYSVGSYSPVISGEVGAANTSVEGLINKPRRRSHTLQTKLPSSLSSNVVATGSAISSPNSNIETTKSLSNIMSLNAHVNANTTNGSNNGQSMTPISQKSDVSTSSAASSINTGGTSHTVVDGNSSGVRANDHSTTSVQSNGSYPARLSSISLYQRQDNQASEADYEHTQEGKSATNGATTNMSGSSDSTRTKVGTTSANSPVTAEKGTTDNSINEGNESIKIVDEAQQNIDIQLYQMLTNVVKMVSVVYNHLTSEISKIAVASSNGQQILTDSLSTKIRELTDTCWQAMELSKSLNDRLDLLLSGEPAITERYLSKAEKLRTWEKINAFLKSIIMILGNTKSVMSDLPSLNDIRPNLASLAKITKDVTVILDLSSYKSVSVIAAQLQKHQHAPQVHQQQQQQQAHQQQQSVPQQVQHQFQQQQYQINSNTHVPLLTPQQPPATNPFENMK